MIIEEKPAVAAAKQRTHSGRPTSFRAWRAAAQKFIKLQEKKTSIKRSSFTCTMQMMLRRYIHIALKIRRK